MKQADLFIYSGLLIFLFGMGDDTGKLFSSDIKLTIGLASIAYGALLYVRTTKKIKKITFSLPQNVSTLPSKVYLILGILMLRLDRFMTFLSDNLTFIIIQCSIGLVLLFYGLHRFFLEKRIKRESGNIEE